MKLSERLKPNLNHDYVVRVLEGLKAEKHIAIFGAGDRAQWLGKILLTRGIEFEEFWVNEKYYTENQYVNVGGNRKPVLCFEHEIEKKNDVILVLGMARSLLDLSQFERKEIKEVIPISLGIRDDYLLDYGFYQEQAEKLDELYEKLEDDESRECLYAHMLGRLTGEDIKFEPSAWSDPQYFLEDLMVWNKKECLVDCGAYTGDTVAEFLDKMPEGVVEEYEVYAWEPDPVNFNVMVEKYKNDHCIIPVLKGAFSRKDKLYFAEGDGEASAISENGNVIIDVDTIDNVLGENKATFIKMDVEGSELEALRGARKQIMENKPRLAICVYHKKEDLITIPEYIHKLNPEYRFYLRTHSKMPTELVLFCIS